MGESGLGRRVIGEEKKHKNVIRVRLDSALHYRLDLEAKKRGVSRSEMLRIIIKTDSLNKEMGVEEV